MEIFTTILGLAMIYSWTHTAYIMFKKLNKTTGYEQAVIIFAAIGFILYVMGTV